MQKSSQNGQHPAIHPPRVHSRRCVISVGHASYRPSFADRKAPRAAFAPRRGRACKSGLERELEGELEALEGESRGEREGCERVGEGERDGEGEGEGDRAIEVDPSRSSACHVPAPATCHPSPSGELQHAKEAEERVLSPSVGLPSPPACPLGIVSGMLTRSRRSTGAAG